MQPADLLKRVLLPPAERIAVAVSGGADSVFLLHAVHRLGKAATVLHVNHHLRGAESDVDEQFVRDLTLELGLPIIVHHTHGLPEGNLEQEARRARYAFFAEASETIAAGDGIVATGHTMDDQAETVFYRFLRGAGTAGLSGIRPSIGRSDGDAGRVVRPLLRIRRAEIRQWLTEAGFAWREDSSNSNTAFARNRIRAHHLPALSADFNPALVETLATTAEWARGEEDYWSAEVDRLAQLHLTESPETVLIQIEPLDRLPVAVQRRLLRRAVGHIRSNLRSIDFSHIEAIRALTGTREGSGRLQLPGLDIYRSFDWLRLAPPGFDTRVERDFELPLRVPGRTEDSRRGLAIDVELSETLRVYNDVMNGLDGERCAGSLLLRNWRPGDRFQPRDRGSEEKIKTLFQEFRVPLWERRRWPVVAKGDTIVWTRGFGAARDYAAGPGSRKVLTIREVTESNRVGAASIELRRARCRQAVSGDAKPAAGL